MKKFLLLFAILCCGVAHADTINLHWVNDDGTTYQNSTCTVDGDLILPTPPTKYGYTFTGWKIGNYIPIEYLEGTGTQWIDTNVLPSYTQKWEVGIVLNSVQQNPNLFGSTGQNGYRYLVGFIDNTLAYNFNKQWIRIGNFTVSVLQKFTVDIQNQKIYINDTFISNINTVSSPPNKNIWLFLDSTLVEPTIGKFYFARIYDNGTLVRDFIPVLDYNGIPCMYDRVEGKFYYNQGTGQFIAGPVLTE